MSAELFGAQPGPSNSLIDVRGLGVGHAISEGGAGDSGATIIAAPAGAVASVDVRGGGPGTRETDLLEPHNTVEQVHAIALCGGSAYGLAAADGAMAALEAAGIGFPVLGEDAPEKIVPIVPGAVIFDLLLGRWDSRPSPETGAAAAEAALRSATIARDGEPPRGQGGNDAALAPATASGNLGAGLGASAGALKGGFGQASAVLPELPGELAALSGATVAAGIVVNAQGAVFNPATGRLWGFDAELAGEFGAASTTPVSEEGAAHLRGMNLAGTKFPAPGDGQPGSPQLNTTIGVVATDAPLTKAQAKRLALSAHDGLARAIRPAHMPMDGDTLFGLATGIRSGSVDAVGMSVLAATAANCVERAIVHAVLAAEPAYEHPSWRSIVGC
ncbi:P1 family peptidase [Corynebacterium sp. UMB4614]|uniref:P1 family peptidase n=1 Tax=Corynebacterium sp. UMB4614 TaxID=3046334 RepID=UPI00254D0A64|nr:P1 family peptidase [Corynebacterium sp. UMB4614]MDK7135337.1 P1 family peptidase [Corynebacterium sp. UMB4614]